MIGIQPNRPASSNAVEFRTVQQAQVKAAQMAGSGMAGSEGSVPDAHRQAQLPGRAKVACLRAVDGARGQGRRRPLSCPRASARARGAQLLARAQTPHAPAGRGPGGRAAARACIGHLLVSESHAAESHAARSASSVPRGAAWVARKNQAVFAQSPRHGHLEKFLMNLIQRTSFGTY